MFQLNSDVKKGSVSLYIDGKLIISHSSEKPALYVGTGTEKIKMFRGNFDITDRVNERIALRFCGEENGVLSFTHPDMEGELTVTLQEVSGIVNLRTSCRDRRFNRFWLRIEAEKGEHVTGGGEQYSALDLRGRVYPIWTREQGVGRNKLTEVTRLADALDGGGGDYHTTYFPEATFLSSRLYFAHLENYDYSELDFREENFHELAVWNTCISLCLASGENYTELVKKLTDIVGRQPMLPDWAMKGIWLGVQGGTERSTSLAKKCVDRGVDISAVWIQDWEGKRVTSFGKRLQWDWRWNEELYPGLDKIIESDKNLRWMGYINPYLVKGGVLYAEAEKNGYFVKHMDGTDYIYDFGEFDCGVVDLTNPEAFDWYKNVIKNNMIGFGLRGWMADFGEYLPADCRCFNGETGMTAHNEWPMLWAKCNREAVEEAGMLGECAWFMRSGATGTQRYAAMMFAGDQCVDWSDDDGLPSVITASLSAGVCGLGLMTSDIGGYTTLFHLKRENELVLRWLELACFTPVMRTHEGNRPDTNVQLYSEDVLIDAAARISHIHTELLPYMKSVVKEHTETGLPAMRPLFIVAPEEDRAYDHKQYSFMLGSDMLVAPVVTQGSTERRVWLPEDEWIHLWTGEKYTGGEYTVSAPIGQPPVFYREKSAFAELFSSFKGK